jgi:hypothetical protein
LSVIKLIIQLFSSFDYFLTDSPVIPFCILKNSIYCAVLYSC